MNRNDLVYNRRQKRAEKDYPVQISSKDSDAQFEENITICAVDEVLQSTSVCTGRKYGQMLITRHVMHALEKKMIS